MKKSGLFAWTLLAAVALWSTAASAEDEKAARMWKSKCGSCHGADGKGATKKGATMGIADMTAAAWQTEFTDAKIKETVNNGVSREKNGKKQDMDAVGKELEPAQIDALIAHIRTVKK